VPERRASRFALEVLFLVALATALTFADLKPAAVVGLMLLGWVFIAIFEWVSLRSGSHYGRGLPPRYYVPRVSLPPRLPIERPDARFPVPELRDAPTWHVPADASEDDDWPWLRESDPAGAVEETAIGEPVEAESVAAAAEVEAAEEKAREEEAPEQPELPLVAEADSELEGEADVPALEGDEAPVLADPAPGEDSLDGEASPSIPRTARHRIDPLEPSPGRRRRRRNENDGMIEVPARPTVRVLPGTSRREE
jgi:hypothetical protein